MATVRKRTWTSGGNVKSAWVADYFDQTGKRHIKTFARQTDAKSWLGDAMGQVKEGTHTPEARSITVKEAAEVWYRACKAGRGGREPVEPHTLRSYRNHVDLHINPRLGDMKLARLSAPAVVEFRDDLLSGGNKLSRAMARKVLTSFKSILGEAMVRGLVAQNVAAAVRIGADGRAKENVEIPAPADVKAIFAKLDELASQTNKQRAKRWRRWRAFLMTAALTGMRASELRGVYWSCVDLANGRITVDQRADETGVIGAPKSKAGRRAIAIPPQLVEILREWKLECPPGELVFPAWTGKVESLGNVHSRAWKPILRACGLPAMKFHALRHFRASMLIASGTNPKEAMVELGHANIAITYDLYGHLFHDDDQHAREAVRASDIAGRLF